MDEVLNLACQVITGLLYANAGEWLMHKYILHGLGRKPGGFWSYHWYEHHAVCARQHMVDPGYQNMVFTTWNTQTKELLVLAMLILLHWPLAGFIPGFVAALYGSLGLYYYRHRRAHLDADWAQRHLPWHYDHHVGKHSSANWCVTWPWFDYLLGTRIKNNRKV